MMSVLGLVTVGASVATLPGVWPSDVSARSGHSWCFSGHPARRLA